MFIYSTVINTSTQIVFTNIVGSSLAIIEVSDCQRILLFFKWFSQLAFDTKMINYFTLPLTFLLGKTVSNDILHQ